MRALVVITAVAALVAWIAGGTAGFGRVLLGAGMPRLASLVFDDPHWQGVALYRAGDTAAAADAFREARAHYNRGTAQARGASYAAALESYDLVIHGGDDDARANFDLIAAYYAGLGIDPETLALFTKRSGDVSTEAPEAEGNARAAGAGDEVTNSNTMLGLVELDTHGRLGVRRIFDDRFMIADERWLQQLSDVPGDYLAARIAHERKRRAKLGLTPPDPEDPR